MVILRRCLRTVLLIALIMGFSGFPYGVVLAGLNDGLVAYYPFNGNANDESGNGHYGTVHGATLTEDRFGNADSAFYFDGNDYIEISSGEIVPQNTITISAWIKIPVNFSDFHHFNHGPYFTIFVQNDDDNGYVTHQVSISEHGYLTYGNMLQ